MGDEMTNEIEKLKLDLAALEGRVSELNKQASYMMECHKETYLDLIYSLRLLIITPAAFVGAGIMVSPFELTTLNHAAVTFSLSLPMLWFAAKINKKYRNETSEGMPKLSSWYDGGAQ